jgi:predicted secreted protein
MRPVQSRELAVKADALTGRLADSRSKRVVFLAHCILNQNTRYLGGACRSCCVREIVDRCLDADVAIVQLVCPEQQVWGGVLKRRMLRLYGADSGRGARPVLAALLPVAERYTRRMYRRLAHRVAREIEDYVHSGFAVLGIVGIDGSPSCGVGTTIDMVHCAGEIMRIRPRDISVDTQNALVRRERRPGRGIFMDELRKALDRRKLTVPFLAHDLFDELDGRQSRLRL